MNGLQRNKRISKAQLEVWEMKAALYERVKNLPLKEALENLLISGNILTEKLIKEGRIHFQK